MATSQKDVKAGGAFVEISARDKTSAAFAAMRDRLQSLGKIIAGVGAIGTTAFLPFLKAGVDRAVEIDRLASELGFATEEMQKFKYAADIAGVSIQDIIKNPEKFKDLLSDAPLMDSKTIQDSVAANRAWKKSLIEIQTALTPLISAVSSAMTWVSKFFAGNKVLINSLAVTAVSLVGTGVAIAVIGRILPVVLMSYRAFVLVLGASRIALAAVVAGAKAVATASIGLTVVMTGLKYVLAGLKIALFSTSVAFLFLLKPMILLPLLIGGGIAALLIFTSVGKSLGNWLGNLGGKLSNLGRDISELGAGASKTWVEMGREFGRAFGIIVDKIQSGDLEGAFTILTASLEYLWKKLTINMKMLWAGVVAYVKEQKIDTEAVADSWATGVAAWGLRNRNLIGTIVLGPLGGDFLKRKDPLGLKGVSDQDINKGRDDVIKDIEKDRVKKQKKLDDEFVKQLADLEQELQKVKDKFKQSLDSAEKDSAKPSHEYGGMQIEAVRGAFRLGNNAAQQFGEGTNLVKKQVDLAEKQVELAEKVVVEIQRLAKGLAFQ